MNNKGQVLVIFVILIPLFLLMLVFVVDYGLLSVEKRKLNNNTYDAVEYYLNNLDEENINDKIIELLANNLGSVDIYFLDSEDYIEIEVKDNYKSLYNKITNNELSIKYKGFKQSKEIIKG